MERWKNVERKIHYDLYVGEGAVRKFESKFFFHAF